MDLNQKTLIIGRGYVGTHLARWLGVDVTGERLHKIVPQPGHLYVNAAGAADVDRCEREPEEAMAANVADPLLLAERCARAEARLVQLGTGCVYDGPYHDGRAYLPADPPEPASFYARTKALADRLLIDRYGGRVAVLRLRLPFCAYPHPRNLLDKLRRFPALADVDNSLTSLDTLAATVELLLRCPDSVLWGRVSHVANPGAASPFRVGELLASYGLRSPPARSPYPATPELGRMRRVHVVMDDPVWREALAPRTVHDELDRTVRNYAKACGVGA